MKQSTVVIAGITRTWEICRRENIFRFLRGKLPTRIYRLAFIRLSPFGKGRGLR